MIFRPNHLGALSPDASSEDLVKGVSKEDLPHFYVFMDGKPSESYETGGKYCLASIAAKNFRVLPTVGGELDNVLRAKGFKFKKLSKIRKKARREKYINLVLDTLIAIAKREIGLPFNYRIAMGSMEVMNPQRFIQYFETHPELRRIFSATITDSHVKFIHEDNEIRFHHNEFGAMMWWHTMLLDTAKWVNAGENNAWWVHMDRLPNDRDLKRTRFFCTYLDFMFNGKLWISISGDESLPADLFPDFFANMYYDLQFNKSKYEKGIRQKLLLLDNLNTKEYWEKTTSQSSHAANG